MAPRWNLQFMSDRVTGPGPPSLLDAVRGMGGEPGETESVLVMEGLIPQPGISGSKIEGHFQGSLVSLGRLEHRPPELGVRQRPESCVLGGHIPGQCPLYPFPMKISQLYTWSRGSLMLHRVPFESRAQHCGAALEPWNRPEPRKLPEQVPA